ncbi:hypothetical protein IPH19_03510 [Candidatus Uhrbacteria bacterium]|nr:MAG: hypothetical protein IPH19_03510 [Candidatus Uhrbacteria bacterium]
MSRHSFITACLTASLVLMPVMASAQLTADNTGLSGAAAGTGLSTSCEGTECLLSIIGNVINLVLGFLGVVLLVMLLYAGFLWMTSGGDTKGVQAAKTMITNAVAGVVIVAISYALTAFVLGQLATITGDAGGAGSEAPGAGGRGAACSAPADCPEVTCPAGGSSPVGPHEGRCVLGECSAYVCSP